MTLTLMEVAARVDALETQMALLLKEKDENLKNDDNKNKKPKKEKKNKKEDKLSDDDEPKKKKRVTGYNLFVKTFRNDAFNVLSNAAKLQGQPWPTAETVAPTAAAKPKGTDVMKKLGAMWKDLDDAERADWNNKANALGDDA
jgi:hypothetical protein